ncbi:MAG: flagellar motor protein MotD [Gammaproteobacteria bacterium]|nr:flagellar motor protein MotD [Gammaproteobacteria bacterium]
MPRRGRSTESDDELHTDRWLISYADFITLLFAFFVVMYAISNVNEGKYRVLTETLAEVFKENPKAAVKVEVKSNESVESKTPDSQQRTPEESRSKETNSAAPEPSLIDITSTQSGEELIDLETIYRLRKHLANIADEVEKSMLPLIKDEKISVVRHKDWVEIGINSSLLFPSASAEMSEQAELILGDIAEIIRTHPNYIQVEGFTDNVPINTAIFPSNWELSAARAASVVHLFMNEGVNPERMAAIGYGEFRAIAKNETAEGRMKNRRVTLIVLADDAPRRIFDSRRNLEMQTPQSAVPATGQQ